MKLYTKCIRVIENEKIMEKKNYTGKSQNERVGNSVRARAPHWALYSLRHWGGILGNLIMYCGSFASICMIQNNLIKHITSLQVMEINCRRLWRFFLRWRELACAQTPSHTPF